MRSKLLLEKELEFVFLEKFPPFPEKLKEFLAHYGPYVMLAGSVIMILGLVLAFGLGSVAMGLGAVSTGSGLNFYIGILMGIGTLVMYLIAFSPLRKRRRAGWNLVYYALMIGLASNIIQLSLRLAIFGGIVGFWILFQIREKYV